MTYLKHLFNWTRLQAGAWIFLAGIVGTLGATWANTNILTLTWTDIKVAVVAAVFSQITKAFTNYMNNRPLPQ